MYHFTEAQDRSQALAEAHRVLNQAVFYLQWGFRALRQVSMDWLGYFETRFFRRSFGVIGRRATRNPNKNPAYFTNTFPSPDELSNEWQAQDSIDCLLAVEGLVIWCRT